MLLLFLSFTSRIAEANRPVGIATIPIPIKTIKDVKKGQELFSDYGKKYGCLSERSQQINQQRKMNEKYIGLIEVVLVKNFNIDMGWIMDVALLPDYQGMGLGKHLIQKSIRKIYECGYSAVGLGVTLSNKNAHQLYKSLGFEDYEYFVEIIGI